MYFGGILGDFYEIWGKFRGKLGGFFVNFWELLGEFLTIFWQIIGEFGWGWIECWINFG